MNYLTTTSIIEIENIVSPFIVGILLMIISGIVGYFKGRKQSLYAVERKNKLYLPLVSYLDSFSFTPDDTTIDKTYLEGLISNDYKYALNRKIKDLIKKLCSTIKDYNSIRVESIAQRIVVSLFEKEYINLYGTIIDGVCFNSDNHGNEWEEEVEVPELQILKRDISDKDIQKLIKERELFDHRVQVGEDYDEFIEIDKNLVNIFSMAFNSTCEIGKSDKTNVEGWQGSVAEYFAQSINFKEVYENNEKIKQKMILASEIDEIVEELNSRIKSIIKKIVKKYERE